MLIVDMGISYFSNTETRVKPTSAPEATFRGKKVFIIQTCGVMPDVDYESNVKTCIDLGKP